MAAFAGAARPVLSRRSFAGLQCGAHRSHPAAGGPPASRRQRVTMIKLPWQKDKNAPKITLNFDCGYAYLAHPEKNTGEDAFFIEGNSAGVFDGVSGASETRGVDPRLYSQTLAAFTQTNVRAYGGAQGVVKAAIDAADANTQIGASTASVIGMDEFGRLFGINLGDSGVRIIRGGKLLWRTKEQQHFFNCPLQLGTDSEDSLMMGQNVQQKLKEGDWVILATDGLFDNMPDKDIVGYAVQSDNPMELAESLGEKATANSLDKKFVSPFEMAAKKAGVKWRGGKVDDVTIVAIKIRDDSSIQPLTLLSTLPDLEVPEPAAA